ncbi:MAG: hypothetical protein ACI9QL_002555 [Candidatus Omnitrophota bacterium]|jgi:hypothetical protein
MKKMMLIALGLMTMGLASTGFAAEADKATTYVVGMKGVT